MPNDTQKQIDDLSKKLQELSDSYYLNNFTSSKDYNKYSRFNSRLKVPVVASDPTVGEIGDIVCVVTKLKICTVASLTAPVWSTVGTQT